MILNIDISDQIHPIAVPDAMLEEGEEFFRKIDRDMDQGWQMSRAWVEQPNQTERCQIVADKLLTAIVNENESMATLLSAYILKRMPGVALVRVDTEGDVTHTEFENS
jgi:hypothetical protein